ncbi:MAG: hypothetical protein AB1505_06370 [Candidatus Latescibacterota bacterium]
MEKIYRVETTLAHDLAELYAVLVEEFEGKSSIPLGEMNRAVLQTGLVHHLTMMVGLGLVEGERAAQIDALIDRVARNTLLWDALQLLRQYWKDCAGGKGGTLDVKA